MGAVENQGKYQKDLCMVTSLASRYVGVRKRADVLWLAPVHVCTRVRKNMKHAQSVECGIPVACRTVP